ncbi:integrase [Sphingorhabdus lutea]|uniref:Integrase n=1 Tax=Sphingorhabdus lutea TaxID=1913578 RepID=A0A1L3JBW6_9SPHN|nr:integrase arm-type DNA-binding domain-containing protein [Sphingorhabdus lutea]APG62553.1 integrase [Sphingorhabdus lutea]
MGLLTVSAIKAAKGPCRLYDGDGLYLLVSKTGAKSWLVRVQKNKRRRDIGLGSASKVSLKEARKRAADVRSQIECGLDPILERKKAGGIPTFRAAAASVHAEQKGAWRNGKHNQQWIRTLETYCFPYFGDISVAEITAPIVRDALIAIWLDKPETARRVRQRIVSVLDWAVGKGYRDAPLAMAGINKSLPKQREAVKHHEAMPYQEVPAFMVKLRESMSMGRLALEFAILTAARSGEVRGATWDEIDLYKKLWTIPAGRMKMKREHVIPLCDGAVHVLQQAAKFRLNSSNFVFVGQSKGKAISDMTMRKILRDMGLKYVPHGFRSSFKDWAADTTEYSNELSEMALAHAIKGKSEAAYRRGSMLDKRRNLMDDWEGFCDG